MPTGTEPIQEGSDFYIYAPVIHVNGASFAVRFDGGGSSEEENEEAVQSLIDHLNGWPDLRPDVAPVKAWKNFVRQYEMNPTDTGEEMPDSSE